MNKVSIIINGVRYDAVDSGSNNNYYCCIDCDLIYMCKSNCNFNLCEYLSINFGYCFKESDKKFEE